MTNFIPIFPLNIVVFPGEALNLHIFEPRYRQMIGECIDEKKPFGLPPVIENNLHDDLGTLIEIEELVKTHPNGNMDIRTRGKDVFRILHRMDTIPDKLFSGAIVTYPENVTESGDSATSRLIINEVKKLYALLNVSAKFPLENENLLSYEIAHYVGMSRLEEYELLGLFTELHRLEYIRRHLTRIVPVIRELESLKDRIQRNGHFRDLSLGGLE